MSTHNTSLLASSIAISVNVAAGAIGISRAKVYELIRTGGLPSIKVVGRRLILTADLDAFLLRHRREASNG